MYAIVEMQGHQYFVEKGQEIVVDKISKDKGTHKEDKVLCVFDEKSENVKFGKPYLAGAVVEFSIVDHHKGDKVVITKFRRKNRYQRKQGFRPQLTTLKVKKISIDG